MVVITPHSIVETTSHNAAVSRNSRAVCLVVKMSDSDTTRQTARELSVCTALLCALQLTFDTLFLYSKLNEYFT